MNIVDGLKLTKEFWTDIGQFAINRIIEDARNGIFQTESGKSNKDYYNKQYAKYKMNAFRRFRSKYKGRTIIASKLKKSAKGGYENANTNLKALRGKTVRNTNTDVVNMELTGETFDGFSVKHSDEVSVTVGFLTKDSKKIIGNEEKYNRKLTGLNPANIELIKNAIVQELEKNLEKVFNEDIVIRVV